MVERSSAGFPFRPPDERKETTVVILYVKCWTGKDFVIITLIKEDDQYVVRTSGVMQKGTPNLQEGLRVACEAIRRAACSDR